jgi:hypothetical protein
MEMLYPGISCEWVGDGRVIVYTLHSPQMATLAAWSEAALATFEAWPKDKPYLAVHNISQSGLGLLYCAAVENDIFNIGVLPQAQKRVSNILAAHPGWPVALGVVVSGSLTGHLAKIIYRQHAQEAHFQTKAFLYRDMAVNWVSNCFQPQPT